MKKLMEYKIISGRVVETRRSWMPVRQTGEPIKKRGTRKAGASSEKKIKANETESARKLARVINSTVEAGDLLATLKYEDAHLPASYEEAEEDMSRFLRILRREFRKEHGRAPWLIWVTANWSPKRNAPARVHHHLIVERDAYALLGKLWQGGGLNIEMLDGRADHSDLAAYLHANVQNQPAKKTWHTSRNVKRPMFTEPEEVQDVEDVQPEQGAVIKEHQVTADEEGRIVGSYLRCVLPAPVKVRGGQIVIPGRRKRRR